jgi:23S rRNA (cytosine1962-C5)-methyltransferase
MEALTPEWTDYELLDSGAGKRFERFGEFTLIRPEPQAKWTPALAAQEWAAADAEFAKPKAGTPGEWKFRKPIPQRWAMQRRNLKFWIQPAPSGHVGLFPDQACHWDWLTEVTKSGPAPVNVLCLFGHTGLATLSIAAAGAQVTHVDASRKAVDWARENQSLSGLADRPIRWIVEDALTFVKREARRGSQYQAMILDPPKFGRGPTGEIWKLEDSLPELLDTCRKILSTSPIFVLLNIYTTVVTRGRSEQEAEALRSCLKQFLKESSLTITARKLILEDRAHHKICSSIFARARQL